MDEYLKDQLKNLTNIKFFDLNDNEINFKDIDKFDHFVLKKDMNSDINNSTSLINKTLIIELASYIINPPANFDLHKNWNHNIKPTDRFMLCEVIQDIGKMVKIRGVGYDITFDTPLEQLWEGWVPKKSITIIKEI